MARLRLTTRDALGPDGTPAVGRGYEVLDDQGEPIPRDRLHPDAFTDIAVVEVVPASAEERQALSTPAFGVDRPVVLRPEGEGVSVLDESGTLEGGRVVDAVASATARLVTRGPAAEADAERPGDTSQPLPRPDGGLATWVSWEWLTETGRTAIEVAVSHPSIAPKPLAPPAQTVPAPPTGRSSRRVWLALAAAAVVIVVAFISCS